MRAPHRRDGAVADDDPPPHRSVFDRFEKWTHSWADASPESVRRARRHDRAD